ncbi:hypothetical protein [Streptomyces sp. NPDC051657]|uniref:hypothetical protein n=1 Tax=unclassified Streptomyces TaxID=2593676 RepID=UPI0034400B58
MRTAVEEALSFDANLGFGLRRYLAEDTEIGGRTVPGGTTVRPALIAVHNEPGTKIETIEFCRDARLRPVREIWDCHSARATPSSIFKDRAPAA